MECQCYYNACHDGKARRGINARVQGQCEWKTVLKHSAVPVFPGSSVMRSEENPDKSHRDLIWNLSVSD